MTWRALAASSEMLAVIGGCCSNNGSVGVDRCLKVSIVATCEIDEEDQMPAERCIEVLEDGGTIAEYQESAGR